MNVVELSLKLIGHESFVKAVTTVIQGVPVGTPMDDPYQAMGCNPVDLLLTPQLIISGDDTPDVASELKLSDAIERLEGLWWNKAVGGNLRRQFFGLVAADYFGRTPDWDSGTISAYTPRNLARFGELLIDRTMARDQSWIINPLVHSHDLRPDTGALDYVWLLALRHSLEQLTPQVKALPEFADLQALKPGGYTRRSISVVVYKYHYLTGLDLVL